MVNVQIAKVCGLCAGCIRAIRATESELEKGKNVTIFKEISQDGWKYPLRPNT